MTDHLALLARLDDLYRQAVTTPERWTEAAAADWAADAFTGPGPDRDTARHVRKALRLSIRLAGFWREPPSGIPAADDWRSRVDLALGARAWRPLLDVARSGLEHAPSPELFAEVKERFRVVHNEYWMAGIGYDEWQAERHS